MCIMSLSKNLKFPLKNQKPENRFFLLLTYSLSKILNIDYYHAELKINQLNLVLQNFFFFEISFRLILKQQHGNST